MLIYLRIVFLVLFVFELYQTKFKTKRDKCIWFFIVLFFSYIGYSIYLVYKRRLVVKRTFKPDFNKIDIAK